MSGGGSPYSGESFVASRTGVQDPVTGNSFEPNPNSDIYSGISGTAEADNSTGAYNPAANIPATNNVYMGHAGESYARKGTIARKIGEKHQILGHFAGSIYAAAEKRRRSSPVVSAIVNPFNEAVDAKLRRRQTTSELGKRQVYDAIHNK